MARLISGLLSLRQDPRLIKLPPYLSIILILVGIGWLLVLPLDEYSRNTYVSENALLPGQVHTYFGGSEHNIFRAYRQEVNALASISEPGRNKALLDILKSQGLKAATQDYHFSRAGEWKNGTNVYGVIQGPRADATEAMVLIGAWRNSEDKINYSGVALVLTLARYFKRWSLWSKDIIVLLTPDSTFGPQAWVDAYHESQDTSAVQPLSIKSGALQGAVAIDYPAGVWGQRFDKLHVVYDGINGQLPNLDLINTAINIANNQIGIGCTIQRMWQHDHKYQERLLTIARGMLSQAVGHSSGPHSSFIPYHVDAITLQTVGDGWHDEMSLGRSVEGLFRSLNNLLEHLHQSFFFYLLMHSNRFVSIGTYLPSAMLIAGSFTITAILLWFLSGRPGVKSTAPTKTSALNEKEPLGVVKSGDSVAVMPKQELETIERDLNLPLLVVFGAHAAGLVPLHIISNAPQSSLDMLGPAIGAASILVPVAASAAVSRSTKVTIQQLMLVQCFSLLILGAALSTLATINFAQSFIIGIAASPLSFVRPLSPRMPVQVRAEFTLVGMVILSAISPMTLLWGGSFYFKQSLKDVLVAAAWAWRVERVWTGVTVWLVWWPAWACSVFAWTSGAFQSTPQRAVKS
ncbi:GPI transamidase component-like protein [Elsinoe fawcettii]|nr:GPI transamidase component-like protein [Elsinoe fawcettii]